MSTDPEGQQSTAPLLDGDEVCVDGLGIQMQPYSLSVLVTTPLRLWGGKAVYSSSELRFQVIRLPDLDGQFPPCITCDFLAR